MRCLLYLGKSTPTEVVLMITEVSEETSLLDGAPPCSPSLLSDSGKSLCRLDDPDASGH